MTTEKNSLDGFHLKLANSGLHSELRRNDVVEAVANILVKTPVNVYERVKEIMTQDLYRDVAGSGNLEGIILEKHVTYVISQIAAAYPQLIDARPIQNVAIQDVQFSSTDDSVTVNAIKEKRSLLQIDNVFLAKGKTRLLTAVEVTGATLHSSAHFGELICAPRMNKIFDLLWLYAKYQMPDVSGFSYLVVSTTDALVENESQRENSRKLEVFEFYYQGLVVVLPLSHEQLVLQMNDALTRLPQEQGQQSDNPESPVV